MRDLLVVYDSVSLSSRPAYYAIFYYRRSLAYSTFTTYAFKQAKNVLLQHSQREATEGF